MTYSKAIWLFFASEMKLRENILKAGVSLMIALVALMGFNSSAYTHTHMMSNGRMQSHAHPYNKTDDSAPIKSHSHTTVEFVVLGHFSLLFLSTFLILGLLYSQALVGYIASSLVWRNPLFARSYQGRAPPIFC